MQDMSEFRESVLTLHKMRMSREVVNNLQCLFYLTFVVVLLDNSQYALNIWG